MDHEALPPLAPAPSIEDAPPLSRRRGRRLVVRALLALVVVAALAVAAALWRVYESPEVSIQLLVLGLRYRSAPLVHATLDTQATLASLADELATEAEAAPGHGHSLLGLLQSKIRGLLAGSARGHLVKVGAQVLDAYLDGRTTGDAASATVWAPLTVLFSVDQAKIKGWLGESGTVTYVGTERGLETPRGPGPATSPPPPMRAAVRYRLAGAGVAPTELVLLVERRGLLWQLVGVANARAVVDAFRASQTDEDGDAAGSEDASSGAPAAATPPPAGGD
jgi:hypothetical protein